MLMDSLELLKNEKLLQYMALQDDHSRTKRPTWTAELFQVWFTSITKSLASGTRLSTSINNLVGTDKYENWGQLAIHYKLPQLCLSLFAASPAVQYSWIPAYFKRLTYGKAYHVGFV